MLPHASDVGGIHRVSSHLRFRTLRTTMMMVRLRCGSGVPRTSRDADLVRGGHYANQYGHEKRDELPMHHRYVNSVWPHST
jgi:hypothetical protein